MSPSESVNPLKTIRLGRPARLSPDFFPEPWTISPLFLTFLNSGTSHRNINGCLDCRSRVQAGVRFEVRNDAPAEAATRNQSSVSDAKFPRARIEFAAGQCGLLVPRRRGLVRALRSSDDRAPSRRAQESHPARHLSACCIIPTASCLDVDEQEYFHCIRIRKLHSTVMSRLVNLTSPIAP